MLRRPRNRRHAAGSTPCRNGSTGRRLVAFASIVIALVVMGIKYAAYQMTGSVALYSDALESIVNLVTALTAFWAIQVSRKPADSDHQFGHHKAEYFSAVLEGVLIVVAALLIFRQAWISYQARHAPENTIVRPRGQLRRDGDQRRLGAVPVPLRPPPSLARLHRRGLAPDQRRHEFARRARRPAARGGHRLGRRSIRWSPFSSPATSSGRAGR